MTDHGHIERVVLGSMLVDADALRDALAKLKPEDFGNDAHQRVYRAILATKAQGLSVDVDTVQTYIRAHKWMDAIGGINWLMSLTEGLPVHLNIESKIVIVKKQSARRSIRSMAADMDAAAQDDIEDPLETLAKFQEHSKRIGEDATDFDLQHVGAVFAEYGNVDALYERMATTQGINTGIAEFDRVTMGYQPKCLSIIAARPKMGKSARMVCNAYHSAVIERKVTAVFTLEQDKQDILRRMLTMAAKVPYADIKAGRLTKWQRDELLIIQERIMGAPLYITDRPGMTVTRISSACEKMKRTVGLDIGFIDQLSRFKKTDVYQKGMGKHEVIGEQTDRLKLLAQETESAIVLLAQLRRFEGKGDSRPSLELLKDSGDIEEDADLVELLHRPSYYSKASTDADEIIIAAQREGETKTCPVEFNGATMCWRDIDPGAAQQGSFDHSY